MFMPSGESVDCTWGELLILGTEAWGGRAGNGETHSEFSPFDD
jgi:hypothetical protein